MKSYEYMIVGFWIPDNNVTRIINEHGYNGWKIIDVHWTGKEDKDRALVWYHFRRELMIAIDSHPQHKYRG